MMRTIFDRLQSAGMSAHESRSKCELFARCESTIAGGARQFLFVPGRIEFLGKHTDYAGGRSLVCAVERGICASVRPRGDATFHMVDSLCDDMTEFVISPELNPETGHWSNYPMTVARRVARNFPGAERGVEIAIASDLSAAAGMSSSSALIVAIFLALDAANDLRRRPEYAANIHSQEDLAGYVSAIENGESFGALAGDHGVGTSGGSEDHTAILCARSGRLSQYSFCPVRHERDIPLPDDCALAIGVSGVSAEKTGAARDSYNRASRLVAEILEAWRSASFRDDDTLAAALRAAPDARRRLGEALRRRPRAIDLLARLDQFLEESERLVPAAGDALLLGDLAALGELVLRSQDLAERLLGNQIEETRALARLARECGAVASSSFGAGFGGSVWALVLRSSVEQFLGCWQDCYLREHPEHRDGARFFTTRAGPAALWL